MVNDYGNGVLSTMSKGSSRKTGKQTSERKGGNGEVGFALPMPSKQQQQQQQQ
jgi:hypothetical protein